MKKILIVFGTRPEAIKMLPLVKEFQKHPALFDTKICVTGQHRQMLDGVLAFFEIVPQYDLNLMRPNQNLYTLTADIIVSMQKVLEDFGPDYVFVHGDTTTSTAAALASFYFGTKVCHVEAGLRTYNKWSPFPEEINRQLTGRIADIHFAPTVQAKVNLVSEGIKEEKIVVTGNTVIDALLHGVEIVSDKKFNNDEIGQLDGIVGDSEYILVTGHRRENFGDGFINICEALVEIAKLKQGVKIIYPVHLNPNVQVPVNKILKGVPNIHLMSPLSYPSFIWAMNKAKLIITDSGGVQEEAPSLGKPVIVLRDTTERPEAVDSGTVILVGTNKNKIIEETLSLLNDKNRYQQMSALSNPYGDGNACSRIVSKIIDIE